LNRAKRKKYKKGEQEILPIPTLSRADLYPLFILAHKYAQQYVLHKQRKQPIK